MTNGEIISDVRNGLKLVSVDEWVPGLFIINKLQNIASLFIKREGDDKKLSRYANLWTTIKCLELEERNLVDCCNINIPNCKKVMVSKQKIPRVYTTRFGYLLNVSSVDYDKNYIQTTPKQYKQIMAREFVDHRNRYFWIEDDRIVVPNSMLTNVTVIGMFINKAEAFNLNSCNDDNSCIKFLDEEFVAPAHLLQDITDATIIKLLGTLKQSSQDELINNNSQEKTNPQSL